MRPRRPRLARSVRAAAVVLALGSVAAGGTTLASCDSSDPAPTSDLDPGPTFGIEITVNVVGNGRVASVPAQISCPPDCFARVTRKDRDFDSSDIGLRLVPAYNPVTQRFKGWSAMPLVSGMRARGPAACSPMTRNALGPPPGSIDDTLVLPYGETEGTPPKGREAECAPFTTVPVAYAITATFEDTGGSTIPLPDAATPGEVLFEPPAAGQVVAREIGVHGDQIFFRYDVITPNVTDESGPLTVSGIAFGPKNGKGGTQILIFPNGSRYGTVSIGRHLAVQSKFSSGITSVNLDTLSSVTQFIASDCALATDETTAYCRFTPPGGGGSFLYSWPVGGGSFKFVYSMPIGGDIAVDDKDLYFVNRALGVSIARAAKDPDGGALDAGAFVTGLRSPTTLVRSPTHLLWWDEAAGGGGAGPVQSAPTAGADAGTIAEISPFEQPTVHFAFDPTKPSHIYYRHDGPTLAIQRFDLDTSSPEPFLDHLPSVNGLAVDETYVYWTENDGRVYRARKP